jgi:hypothetical protein
MRGACFTADSALDSPAVSQCRIAKSLKRCAGIQLGDTIASLMVAFETTGPAPCRALMKFCPWTGAKGVVIGSTLYVP